MENTVAAKLAESRRLLQELGQSLTNLVNASRDVFDDPEINRQLQDFRIAYDEAVERLANPSLCIATLGTTSSGKSTIVNALMGRRIAPIEAGEMSGGVLTLYHSLERKLVIEATEGADWETGEWQDLSDDEFYQRIQGVMRRYHEVRRKKDCIAPQIKAYLSLLPACDLELSGLPEEIGIEFLDLPGLKSVQDRTNLAIIQPQVGKAFSLVALDYMQVDEEHRQSLLNELKQVVEYLQGRTDSMIFILNRVDQRGSDDLPLEQRLQQLREEIKEVLSLPKLPDVLPFNGHLLYYAQCAWGTKVLRDNSTDLSKFQQFKQVLGQNLIALQGQGEIAENEASQWARLKQLFPYKTTNSQDQSDDTADNEISKFQQFKQILGQNLTALQGEMAENEALQWAMFKQIFNQEVTENATDNQVVKVELLKCLFVDCAKTIEEILDQAENAGNVELKQWLEKFKQKVKKGIAPNDKEMRRFVSHVHDWSGGTALWDCLRSRISESFSELIILPAVSESFSRFDTIRETIERLIKTRKLSDKKVVEQKKKEIAVLQTNLEKESTEIHRELKKEISTYLRIFKSVSKHTNNPKKHWKARQKLIKVGKKEFLKILKSINEIEKDLIESLLIPIKDAFENNHSVATLENRLSLVLSNKELAHDIATRYYNVSLRTNAFEKQSEYLYRKVRADDDSAQRQLEHDERYFRLFYHTIRQGVTNRAEFVLQAKSKQYEEVLQALIDEYVDRLNNYLSQYPDFKRAIISDIQNQLHQKTIELPDKFFNLSIDVKKNQSTETEVTGHREVTQDVVETQWKNVTGSYQEGSCIKTTKNYQVRKPIQVTRKKKVVEDVSEDIDYVELYLPNYDLMLKQWQEGIKKGKSSLWSILFDWIQSYLNSTDQIFQKSTKNIVCFAEKVLEEQLELISSDFEEQKKIWETLETQIQPTIKLREQIEEVIKSEC